MKFRYIALIALWTLISGPLFDAAGPAAPARSVAKVGRPDAAGKRTKPAAVAPAWR